VVWPPRTSFMAASSWADMTTVGLQVMLDVHVKGTEQIRAEWLVRADELDAERTEMGEGGPSHALPWTSLRARPESIATTTATLRLMIVRVGASFDQAQEEDGRGECFSLVASRLSPTTAANRSRATC
jgi:hypothetical protein